VATRPDIPDLPDLLARSAREISSHGNLDATLDSVVGCLHAILPTPHHVGATLVRTDGSVAVTAGSDDLARELEQLARTLGEGPWLTALDGQTEVVVGALQHEQRWPAYVPAAAALGVRAQLVVRLASDERPWGALSVHSTDSDAIDPLVIRITSLYAAHAAVAVDRARREENLRTALGTRKLIGQAVGIVMARFELDEKMAFRYLVRLSSNSNVKLRDIARDLVAETNGRANGKAR
jgi:GAF domain-containing protein